ncbi:hypothetical protein RJ640_014847 [Escallonia rubra]|uniref:Alanyl-tRNA synthetase class IIc N-terminal domain-containing protein n=1 Tax=Escallonia rubra TaxID=112253 RepID=A0AA88RXU8_9ASTE|nr:hypothetical protein RJ640_014847 [Escallonia rubra]
MELTDKHRNPTKLEYYEDMWKLQSKATFLSSFTTDDGRIALILDSTIFHPQGGGQPCDTGVIAHSSGGFKFVVQDVRSKDKIVWHYGFFEKSDLSMDEVGEVLLLHSAGHLLDICIKNVGLGHLDPGKGYHFPDGPYVEYKGKVSQDDLQSKQSELEIEANALIAKGGKVSAAILPYDEASEVCGGCLPGYIPEGSTPRILKLGDNPGCPCGGTHVSDISEILCLKVSQIRTKKGLTKVFYNVGS